MAHRPSFPFVGLAVLAFACRQESAPSVPAIATVEPSEPPVSVPAPVPAARTVRARLRGVAQRGLDASGREVVELCPGERVAPCPGVVLSGTFPEAALSTAERTERVAVEGRYDGATLVVEKVTSLPPLLADPDERFRNPCESYQTERSGPDNGSARLRATAERLQSAHAARIAGAWWDRPRQTMTLRLTGDVSELRASLRLAKDDRLCVVGGAERSRAEGVAIAERLASWLHRPPTLLGSANYDEVTGHVELWLDAIDADVRKKITDEAGDDVRVEAFLELLEDPLTALPPPPRVGDFPLHTNPARSQRGGMQALGHWALRVDRERRCIYLTSDSDASRVLPLLPFGYAVHDAPLRLVDYDGRVVAEEGRPVAWWGGHVGVPKEPSCGAEGAWSGAPNGPGS